MRPGPKNCTIPVLMDKVRKSGMSFMNDTLVKSKISDPSAFAKEVFEETFRLPFEMKTIIKYTPEEVRRFDNRLSEIRRAIRTGKLNNRMGEFFFNTSARAKKYPLANKLLNQMIDVNYQYKGRQARHNNLYNRMLGDIKQHLRAEGLMGEYNTMPFKKAVRLAEKFDIDIRKLELEAGQGNRRAIDELIQMRFKEESFYKRGEGKLFAEIIDTIENKFTNAERELLETEYYGPRREIMQQQLDKGMSYDLAWKIAKRSVRKPDVYENTLHKVTTSEPMRNMLQTYLELMDNMYVVLDRGVGAYVKAMKISLKGRYDQTSIDKIAESIQEKIRPRKEKGGFYPHFRREMNMEFLNGLMPHFENISNAMSEFNRNDTVNLERAIDSIKTYLSPRTKARAKDYQGFDYSKNFVANIKRYVDEIDRFNFLAHTDLYTKEILDQSKKLFKEGNLDGYASDSVRLIQEMNMSMKGQTGFKNQTLESISRGLLGLEFVSKLGLNFRSAARNASQVLLNFVEFGPVMWAKSTLFYRQNAKIRREVDKMLDEAGLLFTEATPEMEEVMTSTKGKFTFRMAGDKIVLNEGGPFKKFERAVHKVGSHWLVSGMMRKVENMNRKSTFKLAFYKMHTELDMNRGYKDYVRENTKRKVRDDMLSRSRNFAIRMTTLLHYDYSALSKANYLKHPVGRLLGQFQHYAFKFAEYNYSILKGSLGDMAYNQGYKNRFYGQNMARAIRMGMIYSLAPAIGSALTGWNWSNLVEHDLSKRMEQLMALFTGEEEDIKQAFYGRGVGTGLIGAPIVSDAIALGNIMQWWEMDDDDMAALLTGYQDYARVTDDRKTYEIIHILNTQLGRTVYQTIPMTLEGHGSSAAQFEFGLYPDKATKEFRQDISNNAKKYLPRGLQDAFDELQHGIQRGKRRGRGFERSELEQDPVESTFTLKDRRTLKRKD